MKKDYCTQNQRNCTTCSLVNYGRDCHNKKLFKCENCGMLFSLETDFSLFFGNDVTPSVCSDECGKALNDKKKVVDNTPAEWRHDPRIIFPQ